jgi:ribosomal protein S18 acetylase RimI-like enzyme
MVDRLRDIETYYDAVPRSAARGELIGPFTLFVNGGPGWSYYARPSLNATRFTEADVQLVRTRQRLLGIPESFEWVAETSPALAQAAAAAGLSVTRFPLMLLREHRPVEPDGVQIRLATLDDDLGLLDAVAHVAFNHPGTDVGLAGLDVARAAVERDRPALAFQQERLRVGRTITAVAFVGAEPVGIGSHQPVGSITEIVGVGVLPAFRRRGIAASLTSHLVADALQRNARTIFLSAGDETIGRVYERVGFVRVATACTAEPAPGINCAH